MPTHDRTLLGSRCIRRDDARSAENYARRLWVRHTLADTLREAAQRTPRRVVLVDGACRLDCQALHAQAEALAQALLARIPVGSVVSFMLPNWHEAAVIYLGATLAGMVVNPILPSLRDHELAFILDDADSRMIFVPPADRYDYPSMLTRVNDRLDAPAEVVVVRGGAGDFSYASLLGQRPQPRPLPTLDPDAVRMILYTSGTTGRPKGVLHSHNSIYALITQIRDRWRVVFGDTFLVPSPIAHIGGSIYAFECPLLLGTTAVLMERWNAEQAVQMMRSEACTHLAGATPFLDQLLRAARSADTRLPDLKLFVCGGAAVSPTLIRAAAAHFENAVITRVYGSTEVPVTTAGVTERDDVAHAADTDGRPGLAEIRLIAEEVRARGPQMLLGYLHPEDDADAFDDDGFFRTGDQGRWVDGDYLVITGRTKDIIIRSGENLSPKEVEDVLVGHPDIAEVAIVGLPDARTGERACAVVVPAGSARTDVAGLRSFLQAHGVATFKAPEQVVIWDSLPRNDAGKVLKHRIKAILTEDSTHGR